MNSLFLLGATWDESPALVKTLKEDTREDNATVLPLDFWAAKKLREASIAYQTPREFVDMNRCLDLDTAAAKLARTWYEPVSDHLDYKGISLGQVAEYDFTFLFIDALRSVEIAGGVFRQHDPVRVFSTPQFPRIPSDRPNGICFESLPLVVESLARERNVTVTRFGTPPTRRETPFYELLRHRVQAARARLRSATGRGRESVLFMDVPSHPAIGRAIREPDVRSVSLPPQRAGKTEANRRTAELRRAWGELKDNADFREALTHDRVFLSDVLASRFQAFFAAGAPELVRYIEGAGRLVRMLRPRLVVLPEDVSPIRRASAQTFRRHGVPVLVIQHGAVSVDMGGFHVMPRESETQAVWGDIPRTWHIQRGKAADSQVITGNPSFDRIATGYEPRDGGVGRRLRLQPGVRLILVATEWFAGNSTAATLDNEERYIQHTLRALGQLPRVQGVVKLHPNFQDVYERLVLAIAEEEGVDVTIAKGHLWDLLVLADLVIVPNSTVGLEAMILGKPVVMVDTFEGVESVPYVASGAALGASRPEEIVSAVTRALSEEGVREAMEKSRKAFVRAYAHHQDGKASDRVGKLIRQMMHTQAGRA